MGPEVGEAMMLTRELDDSSLENREAESLAGEGGSYPGAELRSGPGSPWLHLPLGTHSPLPMGAQPNPGQARVPELC